MLRTLFSNNDDAFSICIQSLKEMFWGKNMFLFKHYFFIYFLYLVLVVLALHWYMQAFSLVVMSRGYSS